MKRVHTKWGFGMAPEKPQVRQSRLHAISQVLAIVEEGDVKYSPWKGECLSMVKGMFSRVVKQDQWDWFVVMCGLGLPGIGSCSKISESLGELRKALKNGDQINALEFIEALRQKGIETKLRCYLSDENVFPGGCVYILSTREMPDVLKIGYTSRHPIERVKEINRSTGVVVPFGVRAAWHVLEPDRVERQLQNLFEAHRVRADREFFHIPFRIAFSMINDALNESI